MTALTEKYNPVIGKSELEFQPENFDLYQEVARSAYADMLHDEERNKKYFLAIEKALKHLKASRRVAKVLDIGTGTGLLSLMAATLGADVVFACEAFWPVAQCARAIIEENKLEGKITVIAKRSTELTVGPGQDLPGKCNMLVAEVFDTELIGEGALYTFSHALEHLLEPGCLVVPSGATIYAQVVESEQVLCWNWLRPVELDGEDVVEVPKDVEQCCGAADVHDLQLAQFGKEDFLPLTDPLPVFRFDFTGKGPLKFCEHGVQSAVIRHTGRSRAVFVWWDLQMDWEGKIVLSCAPYWAHPTPNAVQWRDHWMQSIYYLPCLLEAEEKTVIQLHSYHDEFSLWFDVTRNDARQEKEMSRPVCYCGTHLAYSHGRFGQLNDRARTKKYVQAIAKILPDCKTCLCVGDGNILSLIAAKLGTAQVYSAEGQPLCRRILLSYLKHNPDITNVRVVDKSAEDLKADDLDVKQVDALIAEPFFTASLLPWDDIRFWHLRSVLRPLLSPTARILPRRAVLRAVAVELQHLWKIRAPAGKVEGFNLSTFDTLCQNASIISDASVEPHPLWEYPCIPLTDTFDLLTFDFTMQMDSQAQQATGSVNFNSSGCCNGIALWLDFELDESNTVTLGPVDPVRSGQPITWNRCHRQGVYFMKETSVDKSLPLLFDVTFAHEKCKFNFLFQVGPST